METDKIGYLVKLLIFMNKLLISLQFLIEYEYSR